MISMVTGNVCLTYINQKREAANPSGCENFYRAHKNDSIINRFIQ